jgi:hypothetical protein
MNRRSLLAYKTFPVGLKQPYVQVKIKGLQLSNLCSSRPLMSQLLHQVDNRSTADITLLKTDWLSRTRTQATIGRRGSTWSAYLTLHGSWPQKIRKLRSWFVGIPPQVEDGIGHSTAKCLDRLTAFTCYPLWTVAFLRAEVTPRQTTAALISTGRYILQGKAGETLPQPFQRPVCCCKSLRRTFSPIRHQRLADRTRTEVWKLAGLGNCTPRRRG